MLIHKWLLKDLYDIGEASETLINANVQFLEEGQLGFCSNFTNNSSHLKVNDLNILCALKQYTLSCWVNITSPASNHSASFLSSGDWNSGNKQICFAANEYNSNIKAYTKLLIPNRSHWTVGINLPENCYIYLNQWTHVLITCNGLTTKAYINGQYAGQSTTKPGFPTSTNVTYYYLGAATYYSGFTLHGQMADFRIYDEVLPLPEIRELSHCCLVDYNFNDPYLESTTNLMYNEKVNIGSNTTSGSDSIGNYFIRGANAPWYAGIALPKLSIPNGTNRIYTLSFELMCPDSNFTLSYDTNDYSNEYDGNDATRAYEKLLTPSRDLVAGEWKKFVICIKYKDDATNVKAGTSICPALKEHKIYYRNIQYEKKDHATPFTSNQRIGDIIYDNSGYQNNGEIHNNFEIIEDTNYNKYALRTKGSSASVKYDDAVKSTTISYVKTVLKNQMILDHFTIEWNMRCQLWGYQNSGLFSFSNQASWPSDYQTSMLSQYDGHIQCNYQDGTKTNIGLNTQILPQKRWMHMVLTYDGKQYILYRNGTAVKIITGLQSVLQPFQYIYLGLNAAGGAGRSSSLDIANFKFYATALSLQDIQEHYQVQAYITRNHHFHTSYIEEYGNNLAIDTTLAMSKPTGSFVSIANMNSNTYDTFIPKKVSGLRHFEQTNNHTTFTDKGIHIYSPPNLPRDGTYGGMGFEPMNINKDLLKKGHTYIITWLMEGQSNRKMYVEWTNYYGWGGGGLSPLPTNIQHNVPGIDFQGIRQCYYRFTINDDLWKICTKAYSHYQEGLPYLSYTTLHFNYTYGNTGPLGTDIYLRNLQMFDITELINHNPSISNKAILSALNIEELKETQIYKTGCVQTTEFYEE